MASIIEMLESAEKYRVYRGSGYIDYNLFGAVSAVSMWNDPSVEERLRDMAVMENVSFQRSTDEIIYITRIN